jgi:predicted transcriptional regulator
MANERQYDIRAFTEAIREVGASPARIAERVGCSRSTVYAYMRKYPEVKTAFEVAKGGSVQERAQFTKEAFMVAIEGSMGIKTAIASRLGCSRQTVDNALARWADVREAFEAERGAIVDLAHSKLVGMISAKEPSERAVFFVLETMGKNEGWSKRQEITGADGAGLFSEDIRRLIEEQGLDMSAVVRQFETMVRMQAAMRD